MKCNEPMCWSCVWRRITGPKNDPTIGCGHASNCVRERFQGSSSAAVCKEYIEDDPNVRVDVVRDTRETFMRTVHQMAEDSGQLAKAQGVLDYFLPDTHSKPSTIACSNFNFITKVCFGDNEGIYLDCCADGQIEEDGKKALWHLGTYKTLGTSLSDMQIMGELGGTLTYFASQYFDQNAARFLTNRELRVIAIRDKHKNRHRRERQ